MKYLANTFIFTVLSFFLLSSCNSPKQLISTSLEVDDKNELIFELTIHNSSDTVMRIGTSLNIHCEDYFEINTIRLINEDRNDTLPYRYWSCQTIIDPETYEIYHISIAPDNTHTYSLNISDIVSGLIQKGNYKAIVKLHEWDFRDTIFYKNIDIKKDIDYWRKIITQTNAFQILKSIEDISKIEQRNYNENHFYLLNRPIEKLMKYKFFKTVENNEFSFSKKNYERLLNYAHLLKASAGNENLNSIDFETLKNESKYFHKKIKKAYIKQIPNFRLFLKDPKWN